jgi:hypothetical protein
MYMKKNKYAYATAKDGLEALDIYKTALVPFKTVFMGKPAPFRSTSPCFRNTAEEGSQKLAISSTILSLYKPVLTGVPTRYLHACNGRTDKHTAYT